MKCKKKEKEIELVDNYDGIIITIYEGKKKMSIEVEKFGFVRNVTYMVDRKNDIYS